MSRIREFDDGKIVVKFTTEQNAKDFDEYLASTFTLMVDGKAVGSYKVADGFDPYVFFGIRREEE